MGAVADRSITIEANPNRVRVMFNGRVVADTTHALTLREAGHRPVQYVPRGDADMSLLARTDHRTHCPYKGEAAYFTIRAGGKVSANAVWTYESPHAGVAVIKDLLAFYPDRVDGIEQIPAGAESSSSATLTIRPLTR